MKWRDSEHVTCVFCAWYVRRSYLEDIRRYNAVYRIKLESSVKRMGNTPAHSSSVEAELEVSL
jgi:hypothetical protein